MSLGLVHVYTGAGKGKTTAALGLLLRAAGRGIPAVLVQFLKGGQSGELAALERLPGVTVLRGKSGSAFAAAMSPEDRAATRALHDSSLREAVRLARSGACGLLVLDEVMAALKHGLLDEGLLRQLLEQGDWGLTEEDAGILTALGPTLGRYDGQTQAQALERQRKKLEQNMAWAREEQESQGRLWRTAGLCCGAALALLAV